MRKNTKLQVNNTPCLFIALVISIFGCDQELIETSQVEPPLSTVEKMQVPEYTGRLISKYSEKMKNLEELDRHFEVFEIYRFGVSELSDLLSKNPRAAFKLNLDSSYQWEITLEPSDLLAPGYKSYIHTENGTRETQKPGNIFFKGITTGGERVRLTLDGNKISGFIRGTNEEEVYIENLSNFVASASENELLVYESEHIKVPGSGPFCLADQVEFQTPKINKSENILGSYCGDHYVLRISTFANYRRYKEHNSSVSSTNNDILNILNEVQENYDEFNITLQVVEQQVATCPPCMPFDDSMDNLLSEERYPTLDHFADWARAGGFNLQHDAGIFYMHDIDSSPRGAAFLDELCIRGNAYCFVVDFTQPRRSKHTTTHEIGHLFGARHVEGRFIMHEGLAVATPNRWRDMSKDIINSRKDCHCNLGGGNESLTYTLIREGDGEENNEDDVNLTGPRVNELKAGDFDGDGRDELLRKWVTNAPDGPGWYLGDNVREAFQEASWTKRNSSGVAMNKVLVGDFDGNGKDDVLKDWGPGFPNGGKGWYISKGASGHWKKISNSGTTVATLNVGDFNGDGIDDVIRKWDDFLGQGKGWYVAYGRLNEHLTHNNWNKVFGSGVTMNNVVIGDFNNDGRDDVLKQGSGPNGQGWYVAHGGGEATGFSGWHFMRNESVHPTLMLVGNFMSDSRTDILVRRIGAEGDGWYLSNGAVGEWDFKGGVISAYDSFFNRIVGNFGGNNLSDILVSE